MLQKLSLIFTAALILAGGDLVFDIFFRPPLEHALMNVEGMVALSILALLMARSKFAEPVAIHAPIWWAALGACAVAIAFGPVVNTPFLYDDYTHIADAARSNWHSVLAQFGRVAGEGLFFRPVGFVLYWLNFRVIGANPTWWHAGNIALHAGCVCLVYLLARELRLSGVSCLFGALLFGLSGISAEAVAWVDAGFVILATALLLVSLIAICRYVGDGPQLYLIAGLIFGAAAMLCKETAFCFPFLIAAMALFRDRHQRRRIGIATALSTVLTAALFAYRWWAIGGIGGYEGSFGNVSILRFSPIRTLDALFLRQWAVLLFPVNWSVSPGIVLKIAQAALPLVLLLCAWASKPPRRVLIGCVLFIIAAALPVEHLLLISPDLAGSRTLYLGAVGWALLWAFVLAGMKQAHRNIAAGVLLLLNFAILEHNLAIWRDTAELARSVCADFGRKIAGTSGQVFVGDLPATRDGTVFVHNGFPLCVEMNSGVPASRIQTEQAPPGAPRFVWNDTRQRMEKGP